MRIATVTRTQGALWSGRGGRARCCGFRMKSRAGRKMRQAFAWAFSEALEIWSPHTFHPKARSPVPATTTCGVVETSAEGIRGYAGHRWPLRSKRPERCKTQTRRLRCDAPAASCAVGKPPGHPFFYAGRLASNAHTPATDRSKPPARLKRRCARDEASSVCAEPANTA